MKVSGIIEKTKTIYFRKLPTYLRSNNSSDIEKKKRLTIPGLNSTMAFRHPHSVTSGESCRNRHIIS